MADFKTHVTFSSVLGGGYAVAGMAAQVPMSTSLVAGGLCGVAGMLPDVDSDSGVPRREAMGFAAAIVPMLMLDRFELLLGSRDQIILCAALLYFLIRFTAAKLIGKFSVHRGMWHSIPAVLIFAGLAFLIAGPPDNLAIRYFKAFAVGLGAMSHLVLDEVYSVDTRGVVPKFKKSFGTAIKFWGKNPWANFSTYAKLAAVTLCVFAEPSVLRRLGETNPRLASGLQSAHEALHGFGDRVQDRFGRVLSQRDPAASGDAPPAPRQPMPGSQPAYEPAHRAWQGDVVRSNGAPAWAPQPQYGRPGQTVRRQPWRGFAPNTAPPEYAPPGYSSPGYPPPPAPSNGNAGFAPNRGAADGWGQAPPPPLPYRQR